VTEPPPGTDGRVSCPTHGLTDPLWAAREPDYETLAEHLLRSRPLPTWLPWPLPVEWQVTDFGSVSTEGRAPRAVFASATGPSDHDGLVEVTVVTEEPGVGLGARCAGVPFTDPGREAGDGVPPARVRVEGASVPVWLVSTSDDDEAVLDRAVLAGEAGGRWLWLVLRPASAALLLPHLGPLDDLSGLGPSLVALPFGAVPRCW
jgi:hypothetical protein